MSKCEDYWRNAILFKAGNLEPEKFLGHVERARGRGIISDEEYLKQTSYIFRQRGMSKDVFIDAQLEHDWRIPDPFDYGKLHAVDIREAIQKDSQPLLLLGMLRLVVSEKERVVCAGGSSLRKSIIVDQSSSQRSYSLTFHPSRTFSISSLVYRCPGGNPLSDDKLSLMRRKLSREETNREGNYQLCTSWFDVSARAIERIAVEWYDD